MQIKFLNLYHIFDNVEQNRCDAQNSLLYMWMKSLQLKQVKFISSAKVEFKEYSFFDYPDQEKAKREVQNAYGDRRKRKDGGGWEYYWCGTQYPDLNTLYSALAEQKRFMELTITVNDEDYL